MRFTWGFDEEADACREMKMELAQQIMVLRQQGVTQFSVTCDSGVVAAICAAPSVLASLGLLEGRNATAHAGFQDKLAGAIVHDEEVVVDGNITTSYGLGGAIPFALELVRQLAGPAEADRIQKAIAYRH